MNISKRYAWQSVGNCRENKPLLPQSLRGLDIGKSGCGKTTVIFNLLLQPGWLDYNHLYIFGKSLHQQDYMILRKGFEGGLSKQQISNVFNSQEMLQSPLIAIEKYSGVRNGEIRADFYDDCQNIPASSALDPTKNNLLLLDDCFLGKQTQQLRYDIHCSKLLPLTPPYNSGEFKHYYSFPARHEESHTHPCRPLCW